MKIKLIVVGKGEALYKDAVAKFEKRIRKYISFEIKEIPYLKGTKNFSEKEQKEKEGREIIRQINEQDYLMLLDEQGKEFTSVQFADFIDRNMQSGQKQVVFLIGGAYGFSELIYSRANEKISLSGLTLPHQLARLVFVEQLYRAFSIIRGEPYHHQ